MHFPNLFFSQITFLVEGYADLSSAVISSRLADASTFRMVKDNYGGIEGSDGKENPSPTSVGGQLNSSKSKPKDLASLTYNSMSNSFGLHRTVEARTWRKDTFAW